MLDVGSRIVDCATSNFPGGNDRKGTRITPSTGRPCFLPLGNRLPPFVSPPSRLPRRTRTMDSDPSVPFPSAASSSGSTTGHTSFVAFPGLAPGARRMHATICAICLEWISTAERVGGRYWRTRSSTESNPGKTARYSFPCRYASIAEGRKCSNRAFSNSADA